MRAAQIIAVLIVMLPVTAGGGKPPGDLMREVKRGWYCDAVECVFPGIPYAVPVDRRFDK